ncbi:hypothetical protein [Kitasatospora sp. NPDC088783]|uniref:hypothetical protein n=1 Tax=Kitasatospora sp. NPDC088783 TaxID=3364077 RepID=UPI00380BB8F4
MLHNPYLRAVLRGVVGSAIALLLARLARAAFSPAVATLIAVLALGAAMATLVAVTIAEGRRQAEADSARED